jgi:hypothetical protein
VLETCEVAVPLIAAAVNVLVQLLAARVCPRWGYLRFIAAGFAAGLVSLLALEGILQARRGGAWQETAAVVTVNVLTYSALAFCFFAGFVNPAVTSLRVRLFRELQKSADGLAMETITALYDHRRLIALRIDRLVGGRQVVRRDGRYVLEGSTLWFICKVVFVAKRVVLGKASEFAHDPAPPEDEAPVRMASRAP